METAIANSKLLPAAVKATEAVWSYFAPIAFVKKKPMINIKVKYSSNGIEISNTSIGISTINSPFSENITTIVNNKAIKVMGEILGINTLLYHSSPLSLTKKNLLKIPIRNGMPK